MLKKKQSFPFFQLARLLTLNFLLLVAVVAPEALARLTALLTPSIAVAIFFKAARLAAITVAFCICLRVSAGEGVGIARDDFVDGL